MVIPAYPPSTELAQGYRFNRNEVEIRAIESSLLRVAAGSSLQTSYGRLPAIEVDACWVIATTSQK
ncbi:MAG: hypothetical protein VKL59_18565 [Nostocaceae cyanobacterium]|nr:hypothetical protein [Nostocaceae cyanobacterium]